MARRTWSVLGAFGVLMACCLALALAPTTVNAADSDFVIKNGVLTKYQGAGGDVVIPNSVTSIGDYAFRRCDSLTSVVIPNSVTSIGDSAFEDCSSLTSVVIPNSVTSIGDSAFKYCDSLTSVVIPNSVTSIGYSAFRGCSLTSVVIPDSVTSIGYSAFEYCSSLTEIVVAAENKSYSSQNGVLFNKEKTELVAYPGGKSGAHVIPNSVTSIGEHAFSGCGSLTSVEIPNSVTSIGDHAFEDCDSLTSVVIGNSVTSIGAYAFWHCSSLTEIVVAAENKSYSSQNGVLFNKEKTELVAYPGGKSGAYVIPNSVTSIGYRAFEYCGSLTSVVIPNSVTSIGNYAFGSCQSLTSAGPIGSGCSIEFGWTKEIPANAFSACRSLTSVVIPNSVTSIGDRAFYDCDSLTSVVIPNSVTSIGGYAFYCCSSLTSVVIGNSVTSIGYRAFAYCSSLTSAGPIGSGCSIEFGWTKEIPANAFSGCDSLTSVVIPDSVTSIGDRAFEYCSSLTSVVIPNSVTSIGDRAFEDCSSLTSVVIGNSVTSIGEYAFGWCQSLTSVVIPNSVTSIGAYAFGLCQSLTSAGPIGSGCSIEFGWTKEIPAYAFSGCDSLTSVTIPNSVTSIKSCAFDGCSSLTNVYYNGSKAQWKAISIGDYNDSLTSATIHFEGYKPPEARVTYATASGTSKPKAGAVAFRSGTYAGIYSRVNLPLVDTKWTFDLFRSDADMYNHKLAISALVLAANVYDLSLIEKTLTHDANGRGFGFTNFEPYRYDQYDSINRVGHVIASSLEKINGVNTNVIAIACRGSTGDFGSSDDWKSNIWQGGQGFADAAGDVKDHLDDYLTKYRIDTSIPTKLFITGHSRGAAVANLLATRVSDITPDENVYAYTFACPKVTTNFLANHYTNIFNFSNSIDPVPGLPPMIGWNNRFGISRNYDNFKMDSTFAAAFYEVTGLSGTEKMGDADSDYSLLPFHAPAVYMALLLSDTDLGNGYTVKQGGGYKTKRISVQCPVDVAVYDSYDRLLGTITNNVPSDDLLSNGVYAVVDGDEKYLYVSGNCDIRLELTGTDTGAMSYSVQEVDAETGEVIGEKVFSDVALTDGKAMTSAVAEDIAVVDTQLFVQSDGSTTDEIGADGSETEVVMISFDTDLGEPLRDMSVPKGGKAGALPAAKRDGYAFVGWYTDAALNTPFDPDGATINSAMTLFAKFEPVYDVYGYFTNVAYDGGTLTAKLEYDYSSAAAQLVVALYQDGKMIGVQSQSVASGASASTVSMSAPGLCGIYRIKAFLLDPVGSFAPISESAEVSFYAN